MVAIGLSTAGAIVFMWLIAYRNIAFLSLIEALVVVWGGHGGGHPVPRTRRDLFQASPVAGSRIGGVPVMVVTAALSLAFFALVLYLFERPHRRRPDVHPRPPVAGVLDRARHRGVRRGLVPRHPAVPAPPGSTSTSPSGRSPSSDVRAGAPARLGGGPRGGRRPGGGGRARGQVLRLVGSTGIRLHCPPAAAALDRLGRPAKDIDVVCRHEDRKGLRRLLEERGWEVDRDLLVAMEGRRYAFRHPTSGLELDVFVDRLEFCHTIELRDRLGAGTSPCRSRTSCCRSSRSSGRRSPTVWTPARCWLPTRYRRGRGARGHRRLVRRRAAGPGLGAPPPPSPTSAALRDHPEGNGAASTVAERVDALLAAIQAAPKSVRWRARARVGERMQWWQDVDEREAVY